MTEKINFKNEPVIAAMILAQKNHKTVLEHTNLRINAIPKRN